MALVAVALIHGLGWLGPAWFLAQGLYATVSALVLIRYIGFGTARDGLRAVIGVAGKRE